MASPSTTTIGRGRSPRSPRTSTSAAPSPLAGDVAGRAYKGEMLDALWFQRLAHALHGRGHALAARAVTRACRHLFACHLPPEVEVGAGTELGYGGIGVIVHPRARIGRDVLLSPGVVIGGRSELEGAPIIGDRV